MKPKALVDEKIETMHLLVLTLSVVIRTASSFLTCILPSWRIFIFCLRYCFYDSLGPWNFNVRMFPAVRLWFRLVLSSKVWLELVIILGTLALVLVLAFTVSVLLLNFNSYTFTFIPTCACDGSTFTCRISTWLHLWQIGSRIVFYYQQVGLI